MWCSAMLFAMKVRLVDKMTDVERSSLCAPEGEVY